MADEHKKLQKNQEKANNEPTIMLVTDSLPEAFRKHPTTAGVQGSSTAKAEVVLPKVYGSSGGIQAKTFTHLEQQEKIMMMMPILPGEPSVVTVTVNDVCYLVKRGVPQMVPMQIAEMLNDRLASEGYLVSQAKVSEQRLKMGGMAG